MLGNQNIAKNSRENPANVQLTFELDNSSMYTVIKSHCIQNSNYLTWISAVLYVLGTATTFCASAVRLLDVPGVVTHPRAWFTISFSDLSSERGTTMYNENNITVFAKLCTELYDDVTLLAKKFSHFAGGASYTTLHRYIYRSIS